MIVRDRGELWQLVRQPDHADLSGQLSVAWGGGELAPPSPASSVVLAATRHDDGWAVFDRRPAWDGVRGRPLNFIDIAIRSHLAFYRACIEVVNDEDSYAGLLVSMHAVGLYNGRYGAGSGIQLTGQAKDATDAFIGEQEAIHAERAAALGISEQERWANYRLLQAYDHISLALCLREWESSDAQPQVISRVPIDYSGAEIELRLEPLGPWRLRIDPYPFAQSPARFTLVRKLLLQAPFSGNEDFRRAYFATRAEVVEITAEA